MAATYIEKVMHHMICCDCGVYSREIINIFLVGQVSGLVENFSIGIFSDTIYVINVKVCMMVLLIELYLFIPFSVTLTIFQGYSNVELVSQKCMCSYPINLKLFRIVRLVM